MIPTKHNLAAEIVERFHGPNRDSKTNMAVMIETLLEPVYSGLYDEQIKRRLLETQRDHLVRMEERQRMLANQLREQLAKLEEEAIDRGQERDLQT